MFASSGRCSASRRHPRNIACHIWCRAHVNMFRRRPGIMCYPNLFAGISILSCAGSSLPLITGRSIVDVYIYFSKCECSINGLLYVLVQLDAFDASVNEVFCGSLQSCSPNSKHSSSNSSVVYLVRCEELVRGVASSWSFEAIYLLLIQSCKERRFVHSYGRHLVRHLVYQRRRVVSPY